MTLNLLALILLKLRKLMVRLERQRPPERSHQPFHDENIECMSHEELARLDAAFKRGQGYE